jgi:hypothetical protein
MERLLDCEENEKMVESNAAPKLSVKVYSMLYVESLQRKLGSYTVKVGSV